MKPPIALANFPLLCWYFATGMRSATSLVMTTGDFAAGLRTDPAAELVRGDFATGQRTGRPESLDGGRAAEHVPAKRKRVSLAGGGELDLDCELMPS